MDDSHHPDARTRKKPRCESLDASVTPHCHQKPLKQSQTLPTPPITPPRSPRSSISTTPLRASAQQSRPNSKVHFDLHMSVHHSTCINTSSADMSESSLWTLPGFDDDTTTAQTCAKTENRWSRLLQNAASSNRDRHRARLEGDGWAFVGGRYSDELHELSDESGESVDEEFDVVVLARESVGC